MSFRVLALTCVSHPLRVSVVAPFVPLQFCKTHCRHLNKWLFATFNGECKKKKKTYVRNSSSHSPALPEIHDVAGQGAGFVAEYMVHPSEVLVQFARHHLFIFQRQNPPV